MLISQNLNIHHTHTNRRTLSECDAYLTVGHLFNYYLTTTLTKHYIRCEKQTKHNACSQQQAKIYIQQVNYITCCKNQVPLLYSKGSFLMTIGHTTIQVTHFSSNLFCQQSLHHHRPMTLSSTQLIHTALKQFTLHISYLKSCCSIIPWPRDCVYNDQILALFLRPFRQVIGLGPQNRI